MSPAPDVPPLLAAIRTVAVGSTNPVKIAAACAVFARVAPHAQVVGLAVPSGVPDQPWGDAETRRGAAGRAVSARQAAGADLGVGFEGGVVEETAHEDAPGGHAHGEDAPGGTMREPDARGLRTCAWAAVATADGRVHTGGSLSMPLPDAVAARVRGGEELGHAMDRLLGTVGIKHRGGAVGVLTAGLVDRQQAYEIILTYALAPLLGPPLALPLASPRAPSAPGTGQ